MEFGLYRGDRQLRADDLDCRRWVEFISQLVTERSLLLKSC
jgi:hypothetical protein